MKKLILSILLILFVTAGYTQIIDRIKQLTILGQEAEDKGEHGTAIGYYTKAIDLYNETDNPYHTDGLASKIIIVYQLRGRIKLDKLDDFTGAVWDFSSAIKISEREIEYAIEKLKGVLKFNDNDFRIAMDEPENYFYRGIAKTKLMDIRGALQDFNKSIEIRPIGMVYYFRGMIKGALQDDEGKCLDFSKAGELGFKDAYKAILKYCQ